MYPANYTGLFPGIHINLVSAALLALVSGGILAGVEPLVLAIFVVAMAITHTFVDFIPSVFLGAPEEDSFLAVLPGHQMLKEGKGYEAVVLTLFGSLAALGIALVFSFAFVFFLDDVYDFFARFIPFILIFASVYLVLREEDWINAGVCFVFAGILGLFTLNLPVEEPLLPLLSGLFGVSSLIVSLGARVKIPKQEIVKLREIDYDKKGLLKTICGASIAAPICSFLPGIGSGHAAILASEIIGEGGEDRKNFLFFVGGINTIIMALSFVTVYAIGRTRTGAAVAIERILGEIGIRELFVIMGVVVISGILAFLIGIYLARFFSSAIGKINYDKISFAVIGILFVVNLMLSNFLGMIVLISSTALGVFTILSGVRRINMMGALLIPTIVFYLTL